MLGSGAWIVVGAVVASIVVADPLRVPILVGGLVSVILVVGAEFVLSNRRASATEEPNRILTVEDLQRIIRQRAGGADVVRDGYWIASLDPYRRYAVAQSGGISVERLLAKAFTTDDDALLARGVGAISERTLRSATAQLSPLSDDGLGSYYWLEQLSLIDDLYLFFRRAAFFVAGGVQVMAPSTGPA